MKTKTIYKIVYVGGAVDHIVLPIITELYKIYKDDFLFISTYSKAGLRTEIGYDYSNIELPFVKKSYLSKSDFLFCRKIINDATVVIYQTVANKSILRSRLFSTKLTFKCTERFYKTKTNVKNFLRRYLGTIYHYHFFPKKNKYVLCMGGYVADDLRKAHLFKGNKLTWGYFTESTKLSFNELIKLKGFNEKPLFCWIGRFVQEKQPLMVLKLASFLSKNRVDFKIKMGGYGPLIAECEQYIEENKLQKYVEILGPLDLQQKEALMNSANYFLFTSTNEEGWGAVVNEAMGSACVCFAAKEAGSPKTLIEDNKNGYLFSCYNQDEFNNLVIDKIRLDNYEISKNAYSDIKEYWNAKTAAKNLAFFIKTLLTDNKKIFIDKGPCSSQN